MPDAIRPEQLAAIAGLATPLMPALAASMNDLFPAFGIDSTPARRHLLAQACAASDAFRTLVDYGSGHAHEGRRDLGNLRPGDGPLFKPRGLFPVTGRRQYQLLGVRAGHRDRFVRAPQLLEQPAYAVWSACDTWQWRGLNDVAQHADGDRLKKLYQGRVIEVSPLEYIGLTLHGSWHAVEACRLYYAAAHAVLFN